MLTFILLAGIKSSQAAVSVTAPTLNISTATFPSVYYPLGNIVITEVANGDFSAGTNVTLIIQAPTNFEFQPSIGTVSFAASANISAATMTSVTANLITITYSSSGTNKKDVITITGLMVRATNMASTGNATRSGGTGTIAGLPLGTVMANFTSTLATGCTHTLTITDTFGDGWNGGTLDVTVNGVTVLTGITLAAGSGPEDHTFTAANGDVITVIRTADGTFPSEMRVTITGGAANVILAAQEPVVTPGTSVMGCCAPTVPGLASYTSPSNGTIDQDVCGITLTWDAPTANGCNTATSYDVYFGTSVTPPLIDNTTATSYSTSFLTASTTYYWKIVPKNAIGNAVGALTWSFTSSAANPVPGLATYNTPANGATNQNCCGVALNWTEPAVSGCNAATSYDVYFGTSATPPLVGNFTGTTYNTGALNTSTTYYWKIVPRNSFGTATGAITRSFTTSATICSACTHTIRLTDDYGDGWNGGTITVTVNGVPVLTNIALVGLTGPEDFTFSAADGDVIIVTRTADGSYPSEMRFELLGAAATVILPIQQPVTTPGTNVSGCCTPLAPSCASNPSPANGATNIDPCSPNFSWTAPASSGCDIVSSYDVYFGTNASPAFYANMTATAFMLPGALADNTTYYWKVVPKNAAGAATGCSVWSFTTSSSSNPYYCLYGSALNYPSGGANCAQLTSASATQNGCAWNRGTISFASAFDYSIQMYFGASGGGADGCAFVFQNSPLGISQCGDNGGQLGAGGISNAVVVEFDTYDNDNPSHIFDIAADHTAIEIDGDMQGWGAPLCGPVQADPLDALLADGLLHTLRVTWDPATNTLCVYVDGSQRISCVYDYINNVFGGNPNVWWGFTGSTGLLANQQYFCPLTIPLPVEMMQFNATCNDGNPLLTWYTASETNNHYFVIERSEDGSTFDSIARVQGSGNTNAVTMYQFVDYTNVASEVYYRLRQMDFNGENTELGITTTTCNTVHEKLTILSVNQENNSEFNVSFSTGVSGNHQILLFDINGRLIEEQNMNCQAGTHHAEFCVKPEPGLYLIQVSNTSEKSSYKCKL
ncbi:MAG: hypothetical protein A2W93_06145 [Bacteroidetes bacterium GWF2_43_63]|nr:MAG: hypothetical protein A2W94_06735 [Bacteroidetes bacterium GWE2_42_42]OFY56198.1 MAG: hypothetical protein A2W93_06145 [Bacteroidetes bacterium GWF2_43_63]HBG70562.1 hypothetical protein [Bacteroidales bacterium]HCB61985.1 hypothetical protein [Bacteroidales bacterium]HCY22740.1 hypothetical protein [Bacteroidales bacterium]